MKPVEIILPLRNPTAAVQRSAESLANQSDRNFSVLISDNYSTGGADHIAGVEDGLRKAGIAMRRVRPPFELGRVEHWNWAHHESRADWLKPLFAGDWLDHDYIAKLRRGIEGRADCRYVFCNYTLHRADQPPLTVASPWAGRYYSPQEMQQRVLSHGMQFGPPSAAAFERDAFIAVGGYPTTLPICSDSLMFCTMAARFGALGLAESLCHFNIHDARFSTSLPGRRKDTLREALTYYGMLGYRAWTARVPFPRVAFARLLWRELRSYRTQKSA